jgi:magnesium transporter
MKVKKGVPVKRRKKLSKKAGLAPGTISYVGDMRNFDVNIDVMEYSENSIQENASISVNEIEVSRNKEGVRWININGIHDTTILESVGKKFELHPLVMEDIAHADQRPKMDEFDEYAYLVVQMVRYDDEHYQISTEQLSLIIQGNTLISFQEQPGDLFEGIRDRLRKNLGKGRRSGVEYLVYSMLDTIVDNYFVVLEKLGDHLDEIEVRLLGDAKSDDVNGLHGIKRELIYLRKAVWPMREVINSLSKSALIQKNQITEIYLRDVYDHCVRAIDTLETYREMSSSLMDMYLSSLSNKMNTVMKTLTIISTIFIPLTFIVGVYGMNFNNMPELSMPYSYVTVWVFMIILTLIMIRYFKRKGWL